MFSRVNGTERVDEFRMMLTDRAGLNWERVLTLLNLCEGIPTEELGERVKDIAKPLPRESNEDGYWATAPLQPGSYSVELGENGEPIIKRVSA